MFTPAIAASSGSAPCCEIISNARATPRMPLAEEMTTGRVAGACRQTAIASPAAGRARASRGQYELTAAAAPAPTKSRRVIDTYAPCEG